MLSQSALGHKRARDVPDFCVPDCEPVQARTPDASAGRQDIFRAPCMKQVSHAPGAPVLAPRVTGAGQSRRHREAGDDRGSKLLALLANLLAGRLCPGILAMLSLPVCSA